MRSTTLPERSRGLSNSCVSATAAPMPQHAITLRCILWRHGLPDACYASPQFRALCRALDEGALLLTVLHNVLHAMVRRRKSAASSLCPMLVYSIGVVTVVYNGALLAASRRWPDIYFRYRHYFLLGSRLVRAASLAEWMLYTRTWLASPAAAHAIAKAYAGLDTAPTPKLTAAFSSVLAFSGALHSIAHTATVPLPLAPQAACLLAYAAALLVFQAPLAAAGLALSPYRPQLQDACQALNTAVVLVASVHGGTPANVEAIRAACRDQSPLLLVVAVQLYFGLMVPLYCASRLERGLHAQFGAGRPLPGGQAVQRDTVGDPGSQGEDGWWAQLGGDVLLLLLLLAWSWLLAVACHQHLLHLWRLLGLFS